jgi:glutamate racemase
MGAAVSVRPTEVEASLGPRRGPLAVFDSGFGGLSIVRALIDLLPGQEIVYLGDSARYPYGSRPLEEVRAFACQVADYLVERTGAEALVVACNTASAAALDVLGERLAVPVVGVIEPGVRALARVTHSGRVGVIGTVATIASGAYERAIEAAMPGLEVHVAACPGFVELVEQGETDSPRAMDLVRRRLEPISAAGVDALLLGCTHYPFLARAIKAALGPEVVLVSSAEESAFWIRDVLGPLRGGPVPLDGVGGTRGAGRLRFLTSGDPTTFVTLGRRFLGPELRSAERVSWPESGEGAGALAG